MKVIECEMKIFFSKKKKKLQPVDLSYSISGSHTRNHFYIVNKSLYIEIKYFKGFTKSYLQENIAGSEVLS